MSVSPTSAPSSGPAAGPAPLTGLRVLVPRAPERAGALVGALRRAGAEPVAAPLVVIGPPADTAALDDAVARLAAGGFDWLSVTSGFTVDALEASAGRHGRTLADVVADARTATTAAPTAGAPATIGTAPAGSSGRSAGTRIAAVGDATARALAAAGVTADFVPSAEQSARGMLAEWPEPHAGTVLVPQGDLAEPTLAEGLAALGLRPHVVVSYVNSPAAPLPPALVAELASGAVNAVVLTSGSTARRLAAQVTVPSSTLVCCIGPRTAEVARELGLPATLVADGPHPGAVVDALVRALAPGSATPPIPTTPR